MSGPGEHAGFAERLDWLQSSIACSPGADSRFPTESLVAVLACVSPRSDPLGRAGRWLADMKAGRIEIIDLESRRYLAALEDLFRLPPGYFRDELIRREVDARIAFVSANGGVRVIGPCRRSATAMTVGDLHRIHMQIVEVLKRRRPAS